MEQQLGLLRYARRDKQPRPRKRSRQVSTAQFTKLRDSGELAARQQQFLDALTAHFNRFNAAPTLKELTRWAFLAGRIHADDANIFRPRCTELSDTGQIEYLPRRTCTITGAQAHPIRPREVGSAAPQ